MYLREISKHVFDELAHKYCAGKPVERLIHGLQYTLHPINPTLPETGFAGAVSWSPDRHASQGGSLKIWWRIPDAGEESGDNPELELDARLSSTGEWAAGRGNHLSESVSVELPTLYLGDSIGDRSAAFAARAIILAAELAVNAERHGCWEVEIDPQRDYSKP